MRQIDLTLFSAVNVNERHDFLISTIEPFDEEIFAYNLTMFLAVVFPIILVFATLLQYALYRLYNRKYHPFIEMVKAPSKIPFKSGLSYS